MSVGEILIVEDDEHIGGSLLRALVGSGYEARWARTGEDAITLFSAMSVALVVLDLGLPDLDGLEVCRRLHHLDPSVSIMMLTARAEELDIVIGLDAGAIDYVVKPFKLAELLARIRAQLRHVDHDADETSDFGDLRVDRGSRRAWLDGSELDLRVKEFDLLARLMIDSGDVVTRESLMSDVWDINWYGSTKTLDFHIAALRRKLDVPQRPSRISTVRGIGYRLEMP